MSMTPLLDRLVDDAAVFPPALTPLETAVREHLARRASRYAAALGPLLVPATAAPEVAVLAAEDERTQTDPLRVTLVVRPGSPDGPLAEAVLAEAVAALRGQHRVVVTGVEVGWSQTWRSALDLGVPVAVEVGLGEDQTRGLDEIASAVDEDAEVVAKFRTGATPTWPWPDEAALAGFLDAAVLRGLPLKLTGGLHHAVRGGVGEGTAEQAHGLLNVLLAVKEALEGAEAPELADILALTDAELLTERTSALTAVEAARLRRTFRGFGCCGVLDPLTELEALGLISGQDPRR